MKSSLRWKKSAISTSLAAIFCASGLLVEAQEPASAPRPAVVVVRHGEDLDERIGQNNKPAWDAKSTWKSDIAPSWPDYTVLPANTTVGLGGAKVETFKVQQHGLSVEGEEQAKFLGTNLNGVLQALGIQPITRVVTKRPFLDGETAWPTPNPFDTIYPYLLGYSENNPNRTLFPGELILIKPNAPLPKSASDADKKSTNPVDKGLDQMIKEGTLLDGQGSTVVAWDAEGIWGLKTSDGKRPFNPQGLLGQLGAPAINDHFSESDDDRHRHGKGVPAKGARLYIFMPRDRPAGYDCTVVDVVNDPAGQTVTKSFEVVAELSVDHQGTLDTKYPGEVVGKYPGEVDDPD